MEKILKGRIRKIVVGKFEQSLIDAVERLDKLSGELEKHGYEIRGLSVTLGPMPEFKVDLVRTGKKSL